MKIRKRILALFLLISLFTLLFPNAALAATDFEITSISVSPSALPLGGGSTNISITIKNTGADPITNVSYNYYLPSGILAIGHGDTIAVGASKTYTEIIQVNSDDVNIDIEAEVWCQGGGWVVQKGSFKVIGEDNVIRSGELIEPDNNIYYVGDTVSITDTMRNSLSVNVTNLEMKYYYRRSSGDTDGDTVTFVEISPDEEVKNTIEYTFTEADIDGLRIGSSITYSVDGSGSYTEYNVAHDFNVMLAPTPTPSPVPTDTPAPTKVPSDTPMQTAEPKVSTTTTTVSESITETSEVEENETSDKKDIISTVVGNKNLLLIVIILAGVIVVLVLIAIIVAIARR